MAQAIANAPPSVPTSNAEVTTPLEERQSHQQGDGWSIDIKYPELAGAGEFNRAVQSQVTGTTHAFTTATPRTSVKDAPNYTSYLKGAYRAQVLKSGVVSVLFEYEEYENGAAHPWGIVASLTYDTRSQRVLTLADVFQPGSDYVSRLSKFSIQSLNQHDFADKTAIRKGAGPDAANFKVFTMTDTDLVLHFQQYQVAAGAMPSQEVAIPLTNLAPILRKEFRPAQ